MASIRRICPARYLYRVERSLRDTIVWMEPEALLRSLRERAALVGQVPAPQAPGVYAWFLDTPAALSALPDQHAGAIYVGISNNLARRGDEDHFRTGGSGFTTLRRSLGALLKDELRLRARPRSAGRSEQNHRCYRFDDVGERRLTDWMQRHSTPTTPPGLQRHVGRGAACGGGPCRPPRCFGSASAGGERGRARARPRRPR